MTVGLSIRVVDPDTDYLGIEVRASNDRYTGTTRIYAGLDQLSELATRIAGFPANSEDERMYEFGSHGAGIAGGFCSLRLLCVDKVGHPAIQVSIEDDDQMYSLGTAQLMFRVEAAELDRFADRLRQLEELRSGEAVLCGAV